MIELQYNEAPVEEIQAHPLPEGRGKEMATLEVRLI